MSKPITGTVALLKLPIHTTISLDGSGSHTLRKDEDILVIRDIPIGFHLFTLKAGNATRKNANETSLSMAMPIGLAVLFSCDPNCDYFVAREYNRHTEELSTEMDPITLLNLKNSMMNHSNEFIDASKMIHYSNFTANQGRDSADVSLSADGGVICPGAVYPDTQGPRIIHAASINIWTAYLTQYISNKVLMRHSLTGSGDKIIPGAYSLDKHEDYIINDNNASVNANANANTNASGHDQDGLTMKYMPIPAIDIVDAKLQTMKAQTHSGTRRYLASLSPSQRTAFFMNPRDTPYQQQCQHHQRPADALFKKILKDYYNNQWKVLIGEMQLSFCVFIKCSCLKSLEHWRDVIYMLSLVSGETIQTKDMLAELFCAFMVTVKHQLEHFDSSIFHEEDFAGGNVFMPAIQRIAKTCRSICQPATNTATGSVGDRGGDNQYDAMQQVASDLLTLTMTRFEMDIDTDGDNVVESNISGASFKNNNAHSNTNDAGMACEDIEMNSSDEEEDEDDGPVVVAMEEVRASLERNATLPMMPDDSNQFRGQYPFLFAAVSNDEDIIMACARILDEQRDVTLVREAAAYLEDVEAKR
eukprot:scaffold3011_cov133-Chaetoceros_neogracile.AAC.7